MSTLPPAPAKPAAHPSGTDHDALPPGTRFGEFEIVRVLGVGGFGIVYLAKDHSLERDVALKEYMPASLAARGHGPQITVRSSSFAETYAIGLRSFVNEARLLARFDHPSLVKVYRFWEDNATAYMVMPFLHGITLRDTRRAMPHPPDEAWVRSVIAPILSALELLHREGVYHRDIAPDNILLPPDGPPVLLDFGAARRVISDRTQSLTAILKPSYAPIEQYAEMAQMRQGPWTDLYALGAVIHYLLFGVPPAPATARAVQDDLEAIESRSVPGVSPRFLEAVAWMLSLRPNQRPQNGEQLRAVLDGHAPVPARGRPGITIPGARASAEPVAADEPTRLGDSADRSRATTTHPPTHPPTAPAPAAPVGRPTGFNPTAQMPAARVAPSSADGAAAPRTTPPRATAISPVAVSPVAASSSTSQPSQGWPASRAATLPPATGQPRASTLPPPTRPASLPTSPQAPAGIGAVVSRPGGTGSSRIWIGVAAGGTVALVVAVVAGWQFMAMRHVAGDQATAAASAAARAVATSPPALLTTPAAARPAARPAALTTPPPLDTTTRAAAASAVTREDAARRLAAAQSRALPVPIAPTIEKPAIERAALAIATPPLPASAARLRPQGRPVPVLAGDPGTASTGGTPARPAQPAPSAASPRPPPPYGGEPPRGQDSPALREAAVQRPVPAESGPITAREACGKRVFIALAICMDEKCEEPRFRNTQECVGILARKAAREYR